MAAAVLEFRHIPPYSAAEGPLWALRNQLVAALPCLRDKLTLLQRTDAGVLGYFAVADAAEAEEIARRIAARFIARGGGLLSIADDGCIEATPEARSPSEFGEIEALGEMAEREPRGYLLLNSCAENWSLSLADVPPLTFEEEDSRSEREDLLLSTSWAAGATDHERCAAILGSAEPVFFAALGDRKGDAVLELLSALQEAASDMADPLAPLFQSQGLGVARMYRELASDRPRFNIAIRSKLEAWARYQSLEEKDRDLLRLAMWLYVAPASLFVGKGSGNIGALRDPWAAGEEKEMEWLVENWIPRRGVAGCVGEPGGGKSYTVAELIARIVALPLDPLTGTVDMFAPRHFAGRRLAGPPAALYYGSEAIEGQSARFRRQVANALPGETSPQPALRIADGVLPLSSPIVAIMRVRDDVAALRAATGHAPALIAIDVLRAALAGDEDKSGDTDLAFATATAIAKIFDCCVLVVHHNTKGKREPRGSGAIKANLDFAAFIEKKGSGPGASYELEVIKSRHSGAEGEKFAWHIDARGVLTEGAGSAGVATSSVPITRRRMLAAANTVRRLATTPRGVAIEQLNHDLPDSYPELFIGSDGKPLRAEMTKARHAAKKASYIAEVAEGRFVAGPVEAPPFEPEISQPPITLEDLV